MNKNIKLPVHVNPTDPMMISKAPYNFVPLPECIVSGAESAADLPDHDQYYSDRLSGYFDVTLTTKSPMYIRGLLTRQEYSDQKVETQNDLPFRDRIKNKPDFYYTHDPNQPVIPGSSLRGMIRNVFEIITYSKIQPVSKKEIFFRTMDDSILSGYYRDRMAGNVKAGYLIKSGGKNVIRPVEFLKVPRTVLFHENLRLYDRDKHPDWRLQYRQIWFKLTPDLKKVAQVSLKDTPGWEMGRLVITGDIPRKKHEFIFIEPFHPEALQEIPDAVMELFHSDDQISKYQKEAFPANRPDRNSRRKPGYITQCDNEFENPVFYLIEKGKLTFFGRACNFRLPYEKSAEDFVPKQLRDTTEIDLTEAVFGYCDKQSKEHKQGHKARAYAGRVSFGDAELMAGQTDILLTENVIVPKILSTPSPSAFQHYLTQKYPDDRKKLYHYGSNSPNETVIRGFKRYWHQNVDWENKALAVDNIAEKPDAITETQHTTLKPLKPGIQFHFKVHFENLSTFELGALIWALRPGGPTNHHYPHQLGMGKPFGMGSAILNYELNLINRKQRYSELFSKAGFRNGATRQSEEEVKELIQSFETEMSRKILNKGKSVQNFRDIPRISSLLTMMKWPGLSNEEACYIPFSDIGKRKVLPSPDYYSPAKSPKNIESNKGRKIVFTPPSSKKNKYEVGIVEKLISAAEIRVKRKDGTSIKCCGNFLVKKPKIGDEIKILGGGKRVKWP